MRGLTIKLLILLVTAGFFYGCESSRKRYIPEVDNSKLTEIPIHIKRYGEALFSIDTNRFKEGLKSIKPDFKLFLDADLDDPANVKQLKDFVEDTLNRYLYRHTIQQFPDLSSTERDISQAMSYHHYYFPNFKIPGFYSYVSGAYYEAPVIVNGDVVLIGLDNYLGADFVHYARMGLPRYKMRWMIKQEVPVDVMRALYRALPFRVSKQRNLLDRMITAGKELFYLDAVMPGVADSLKIRYTQRQLTWVETNEKYIWAFLISQKLLFSADFMQTNKLMQDGPFTKGFKGDAPARIGEWTGWQIVSAYMKRHPEVTLTQLFKMSDSQKILEESGYKP